MYTGEKWNQQWNTSAVDARQTTDFTTKFSEFQTVPVHVADLEPGDALYIPAKWWHQVESLDLSASVNSWWR
jgi:lysine-specific demethylase 8